MQIATYNYKEFEVLIYMYIDKNITVNSVHVLEISCCRGAGKAADAHNFVI